MTQDPNQFNQAPEKGDLDLKFNGSVISAIVASTEAATLVAGQAVKLADVAGRLPQVIALAGATTEASGFIVRNFKDSGYDAGDRLELALEGSVMLMEAGAAIAVEANVEFVPTGNKVITSAGTNPIVGWALDKAAADGDLIRVFVTKAVTP